VAGRAIVARLSIGVKLVGSTAIEPAKTYRKSSLPSEGPGLVDAVDGGRLAWLIRELMVMPATLVLFGGEMALSRFWHGRYRFGPAEWLWRSLTYRRREPLTIRPLTPQPGR
jgi:hypothetical protein